jgi:hypothetical protein
MSLAVIDAREWQNRFDLETGQPRKNDAFVVEMAAGVLSRHPYPGDVDEQANQWVTDTALDLIAHYDPDLVCLSYVQQFFSDRHFNHPETERERLFAAAMTEADRFVDQSGFTPVIVGTGNMIPLAGDMDLSGLDGLAVSSNWSARYCGIHGPSRQGHGVSQWSLDTLERIVPKQEWIDLFKKVQPDLEILQDTRLMPDFPGRGQRGAGVQDHGHHPAQTGPYPGQQFSGARGFSLRSGD